MDKHYCPECGHEFEQGEYDYNYDSGLLDYTCPECGWEGTEYGVVEADDEAETFTEDEYNKELEKVYNFHQKLYDTLLAKLIDLGCKVTIDEDEKNDFRFAFLDKEGVYAVQSIEADSSGLYLNTISEEYGTTTFIYWEEFAHDLIVTENLFRKLFHGNINK